MKTASRKQGSIVRWSGQTAGQKLLVKLSRGRDFPSKLRLIRAIQDLVYGGKFQLIGSNGVLLEVDPTDFIAHAMITHGAYEPLTISCIRDLLSQTSGCFLDVGANMGLHTCTIAHDFPRRAVYAIEPDASNFVRLQRNVTLNRLRNVTLCNLALGPEDRMVQIETYQPGNSGTVRVVKGEARSISNWALQTTISSLAFNLKIPRIAVLKVDVEGFEAHVLRGIDFDKVQPAHIILEYSDYAFDNSETKQSVYELLCNLGYRAFDVNGSPLLPTADPLEANAVFSAS